MVTILRRAYRCKNRSRPVVAKLDRLTNFSDWIAPYLCDAHYKGVSKYYQFVVRRREECQKVILRARTQSVGKGGWRAIAGDEDYTVVFQRDPPKKLPERMPPTQVHRTRTHEVTHTRMRSCVRS